MGLPAAPLPDRSALRRLIAGTLMPGFVGTEVPAWVGLALDDGLASVCVYGANVAGDEQLAALAARLRGLGPRALLTLDEEGGDVTRLHYLTGSPQPGNAVLGRLDDTTATAAASALIGAELAGLGFNLDLAPDADVNSSPDNPVIGSRSFGADPGLVAAHTAAWIVGLQAHGVAACAKHFPGHGDTSTDSHLALPRIGVDEATLRRRELVPFVAAIEAGVASIMTSHIVVPALDPDRPATLSPVVLTDLLRGELGFEGVIVTDALDMKGASGEIGIPEAAVRALAAGADLLCLGPNTTEESYSHLLDVVEDAVRSSRLPLRRVADAARRVSALADGYAPAPGENAASDTDDAGRAQGAVPSAERIAEAFLLGPDVGAWLADPAPAVLVQGDGEANMAVGVVPWGPAAAGVPVVSADAVPPGAKVAVAARGLAPGHPAWKEAESLRATDHSVIVIECGWPRDERPDIVSYGASRAVGEALTRALGLSPRERAASGVRHGSAS